jgi:hypothetical protein
LKQQYILDCKSLLNHMFLRERELSVLADWDLHSLLIFHNTGKLRTLLAD